MQATIVSVRGALREPLLREPLPGPVRRCVALIEAKSHERITLDEMAESARWSKYYLVCSFKRALGVSPCAYLMHERVARACRLLRDGTSPTQVAAECGFADQSHLNRWFKRLLKTTPAVYARVHGA